MTKPVVKFKSSGPEGNIFVILAMVKKELRIQGKASIFNLVWSRVQDSGSYERSLSIIREYVDLVDLDKKV